MTSPVNRDDFTALRRARNTLGNSKDYALGDAVACAQWAVLAQASVDELAFIRLVKAGVQEQIIDLAYAILGEERPGGPAAATPDARAETGVQ